MNIQKIDPKYISETCSPRHIQSVIEDLLNIIHKQSILADLVLRLNSDYRVEVDGQEVVPVGVGMMLNLKYIAEGCVVCKDTK